jgi:carbonic anhydrase
VLFLYFAAAYARYNTAPQTSSNAGHLNWEEKDQSEEEKDQSHCGGKHQSPINIETKTVITVNYPKFIFHNYDLVFPESLENDGHTGII